MSRKSWFSCLFARSQSSAPCGQRSRLAFEPLEQRTLLTTLIAGLALALGCTFLARPTTATATPPTHEWTELLGTRNWDVSYSVSADGLGNVYISGRTSGSLGGTNAGRSDAFVSKYAAAGSLLWTEQLGTSSNDLSQGVSADGLGNVCISGHTGRGGNARPRRRQSGSCRGTPRPPGSSPGTCARWWEAAGSRSPADRKAARRY